MLRYCSTYALRPAAALLVLTIAASAVWCGDTVCWSGTSDEQCSSLICSLYANHDSPNETHSNASQCMCVCHMPTIVAMHIPDDALLTAEDTVFDFITFAPPSPSRSIYHPPKS